MEAFGGPRELKTKSNSYKIYPLENLSQFGKLEKLPYSIKVILESVLRNVDGRVVTEDDARKLAAYNPKKVGAVQLWIEGTTTEADRLRQDIEPPDPEWFQQQVDMIRVFETPDDTYDPDVVVVNVTLSVLHGGLTIDETNLTRGAFALADADGVAPDAANVTVKP